MPSALASRSSSSQKKGLPATRAATAARKAGSEVGRRAATIASIEAALSGWSVEARVPTRSRTWASGSALPGSPVRAASTSATGIASILPRR